MTFEKGDIVKIVGLGPESEHRLWDDRMHRFIGQQSIVTEVIEGGMDGTFYSLQLTSNWMWAADWLEKVEQKREENEKGKERMSFEKGELVKIVGPQDGYVSGLPWTDRMARFVGQMSRISCVGHDSMFGYVYNLQVAAWGWDAKWLEKVDFPVLDSENKEEQRMSFEKGELVKIVGPRDGFDSKLVWTDCMALFVGQTSIVDYVRYDSLFGCYVYHLQAGSWIWDAKWLEKVDVPLIESSESKESKETVEKDLLFSSSLDALQTAGDLAFRLPPNVRDKNLKCTLTLRSVGASKEECICRIIEQLNATHKALQQAR